MGPDEFHDGYPDRPGQGMDNCAYINVMTTWVLARARDAHGLLDQHHGAELWQHMHLTDDELSRWEHIGRRLRLSFLDNGIIEQFEGYGGLAELDWEAYRARYGDIGVLGTILEAEGDSSNRYQASKQADALLLLYLFTAEELTGLIQHLGYDFDPKMIPATVDHYLARTTHGSTLSRVAHAWVLARTNRRRSWHMLREALNTDLADLHGTTTREARTAVSWLIAATRNTWPVAVTVPCSGFPSIAAAGSSPAGTGWVSARVATRRCSRSTGPAAAGRTGAGADTADHVGEVPADRRIEGVTVQAGKDPAEGPLAGHQIPAGQRVIAGPEPGQHIRPGTGRPLPYRRHGIVADDQGRARGQHQDHDQRVPAW